MTFDVGDWVWLRLRQRTASGITGPSISKLGPKFFGPYKVAERIGYVSYRLSLPARANIHDVFHVSLLKKFVGDPPTAIVPLPALLNGRVLPVPVRAVRALLNRGRWELLVQWEGRAATDASWEDLEEFKQLYPSVQLADELFVGKEGSGVGAFVGKKY